jgi:hypothetical protein
MSKDQVVESKREMLTITLTDRPPVRVDKAQWGILASGSGDSWGSGDYSRYRQALGQGELDTYKLIVRLHKDGRAIVYGIFNAATVWTGNEDFRGGELLPADADLAAAIRRVGTLCGLPDSVIRECIADLPAEEI